MPLLGPPNRGNDPLRVFVMAAALVAAAVVGSAIGFLFDFGNGEDAQETDPDDGQGGDQGSSSG